MMAKNKNRGNDGAEPAEAATLIDPGVAAIDAECEKIIAKSEAAKPKPPAAQPMWGDVMVIQRGKE